MNNNLGDKAVELAGARVALKEISAYLTLLEGGQPEDKLVGSSRLVGHI